MYRGQIAAMLVAVLAPWVGNVLYLTGNSPILYLDLTPFAFTITVVALAWAVFGFRLVDITPLARDLVLDSMRDGMIVLDIRGNIVDINNAASHMIGIPVANAIGKTASDVFSPWSHLVERFASVMEAKDEIAVGEGEAERRYEVRLSPLHGQQGQFMGRVIMLRALDETAPQPRFARSAPSQSNTRPYYRVEMEEPEYSLSKKNPILRALINFYNPPMNNRLVVPNNISPIWYRTRERMFTLVARLVATSVAFGWVFFVFAPFRSVAGNLVFVICLGTLLTLGQVRNVNYHTRVVAFFSLVYAFAFIATLNFGFSAPSIVFFMFYVVASAALTSPRGAFYALFTGTLTVGVFSVLIGSGTFTPFMLALAGNIFPFSMLSGLGAVFLFGTSAFIILTSIVLLLDNLDRAWQKETQTLNLLQQERDLLEQRVTERTRALSTARDEAVKTSNDLRKYFRAIEQSGSTIVITDTDGKIEYANPRFEQSTGYSIADAIGKKPSLLKSGRQDGEYYSRLWKTIGNGEVWNGEFQNRRRDGSLYWEYATIAPVMDQNGVITNYVAIKEDITERKNVETQLLKLSQAVEQSGNTVIIMDKNGLIEYVNPKFSEVTGYSSDEALGKSPIALMNGIERAPDFSRHEWWLTVSAGQIWHGEFRNHRKDRSVFWEAATIAPVFNRDGEVINYVEIKQDITEQKIMQDQLQKQNDYLSILHQITLDLLNRRELKDLLQVIVDRSSILLDAPYSKLLLEKDGELIVEAFTGGMLNVKGGRAPSKLSWQAFDSHQPVVLEDYQTWEDRRREYDNLSLHAIAEIPVMAGNRCLGVLALARTEPNYQFTAEQVETGILFVRLVALVLDNASLYDSAVKEIAERKRTEALLQESEARFRQIVESASDIIYRTDVDGNFTYFNPTGVIILGYQHETELVGRNYQELAIPEWRHKLKGFYRRQFFKKEKNTYFEFPAVNPNGEVIWLGQSVQIIEENDAVVGFQAVARDITKLIQAQDALALSRDQALDASRFKSQLLSRVSHELRTPLGGILGYAELLGYKAFGALTEQQKKAVDSIIESTNYLTSVVNDLLDEAQIESKSLSLYNEYFNPVELLENTRASMSVLAVKRD
jgi:PAS domain S-box-containing protein